jgi:hypothetical protein
MAQLQLAISATYDEFADGTTYTINPKPFFWRIEPGHSATEKPVCCSISSRWLYFASRSDWVMDPFLN